MLRVSAPTTGISDEDRAMISFLEASGVDARVTTTTNHRLLTLANFISMHRRPGTNGTGLAIDIAGLQPSRDSSDLARIFNVFRPVEHLLHERIYAGPQISYNIKRGKRVAKYAQASHHDHVHVAVPRGVILHRKELGAMGFPNAVAACIWPSGGTITVGSDGAIYNKGGSPFFGSYHDLPAASRQGVRKFIDIEILADGYVIIADDGNPYHFTPALWAELNRSGRG